MQKKRGPKPDPLRATMRASFPDWSDRRFEYWWKGFTMERSWVTDGLMSEEHKAEISQSILEKVTRTNGTFSVARYLRLVEVIDGDLRGYDPEHDEAPGGGPGA